MKYAMGAIVTVALLGSAIYLLMNGHPTAGGWLIFGAIMAGWTTAGVR